MFFLEVKCEDVAFALRIVKYILRIIRIAIPILLIALVTFDLVKAMTQKSDDEMKKAGSTVATRVAWALAIFFVPLAIKYILGNIGSPSMTGLSSPLDWVKCYDSL